MCVHTVNIVQILYRLHRIYHRGQFYSCYNCVGFQKIYNIWYHTKRYRQSAIICLQQSPIGRYT